MKNAILAIVTALGLVHASAVGDQAPRGGDKEVEGEWIQFSLAVLEAPPGLWKIVYGHELSLEDPTILIRDRSQLAIKGDKITFKNGKHEKTIRIECDPSKSPREADFVVDKETRFLGVYEIKDGQLHLGIGNGKTRPKQLTYDKSAPGQVFIVFNRLQPER